MSIEEATAGLRQDGAAHLGGRNRCQHMLQTSEAARLARRLTVKYGEAALGFARERADRAIEIGDDIAFEAWQSVIEATRHLLHPSGGV
jgi:hypothetical protein